MQIHGRRALKGQQQITSLSSSTALTVPAGASAALIQSDAQVVRWRNDGVAPTASVGLRLLPTVEGLFLDTGELANLRFIEETSGAKLNVAYFG